jgi:uncharacterized protein YndB with AHSA1/START domain
VAAPASRVFAAIRRIGGGNGWYAADLLWRLRGFLDRLVGGPGLRRGRRDPEHLAYGDALDFWRVTAVEPDRRLELRAEMKLPGEALLAFEVEPLAGGGDRCTLTQTARFLPKGLLGLLYWYTVLPFHGFVFRGMLRGIRRTAEAMEPTRTNPRNEAETSGRKTMFGLFKKDPVKKLQTLYAEKMKQARDLQRKGDIQGYALKVGEAEEIAVKMDRMT